MYGFVTDGNPQRFKMCKTCGQSKSVDDFYRRKNGHLGWLCKACTIATNNAAKAEKRRIAREERAALPASTTKTCNACGELKRIDEFNRRKRGSESRSAVCKQCAYEKQRHRYVTNPEVRVRAIAQAAAYAEVNRDRIRAKNLSRYNITPAIYDSMFDEQNGCCAICSRAGHRLGLGGEANRHNVLCVDHDHSTGAVRGLLCMRCNRAIGMLGDSHEVLKSAISYLMQIEE